MRSEEWRNHVFRMVVKTTRSDKCFNVGKGSKDIAGGGEQLLNPLI